jgi:polyhydroxybutyrate depolymerase
LASADSATDPDPPGVAKDERRGSTGCAREAEPGDSVGTLDGQAGPREYRLHLPPDVGRREPLPLLFNFHGSSRSALDQEVYSNLLPVADREGFIVVHPEGSGSPPGWDIPGYYHEIGVDDVGFIVELLEELKAALCIDEDRVYATGFSNGAEMAALLACVRPELFAAAGAVAGLIFDRCEWPGTAVIAFHGTDDDNIPFEYGHGAAQEWAIHNGCSAVPEQSQETGDVSLERHEGCAGGRSVAFYIVQGGGHTWPNAADFTGGAGVTTHSIDANELMWAFFEAHPRVPEDAANRPERPGREPAAAHGPVEEPREPGTAPDASQPGPESPAAPAEPSATPAQTATPTPS